MNLCGCCLLCLTFPCSHPPKNCKLPTIDFVSKALTPMNVKIFSEGYHRYLALCLTLLVRECLSIFRRRHTSSYSVVRLVLIAPMNCWRNSTPFLCKASFCTMKIGHFRARAIFSGHPVKKLKLLELLELLKLLEYRDPLELSITSLKLFNLLKLLKLLKLLHL